MGAIKTAGEAVFRDSVIANVPASGPNSPAKSEIRDLIALIDPYTDADATGVARADLIIGAEISAMMAAGGGRLRLPAGTFNGAALVTMDHSADSVRLHNRIVIEGDGDATVLSFPSSSGLAYVGNATALETGLELRNLRIAGNTSSPVTGSVGLTLIKGAFVVLDNVTIEGFEVGIVTTDVDQVGIYNSEIRFNKGGILANAAVSVTDPNSWTFVNTTVSNNAIYGLQMSDVNALAWLGGSIQYNGSVGGGTGQYGILLADVGTGYGNVLFSGMAFEGNGGAGDVVSQQIGVGATHCNITFDTVSFVRTANFAGVGYGTNQVSISGTGANANYKFVNCNFYGLATYTASGSRPAIANTNSNARVEIDGLTRFWSNTEAPATRDSYFGSPGQATGKIHLGGATSGELVVQGPAAGSGTLTLPAGTTDFSATGGAGKFVKQLTAGGTFTVEAIATVSSALGADVLLNNTSNYFDGPSIAQGTSGTWFVTANVSLIDTAGAATILCKLWDGTTVIDSGVVTVTAANFIGAVSLSGVITNPAGNIRVSCKDATSTSGKILFNFTAFSKDSSITGVRIG